MTRYGRRGWARRAVSGGLAALAAVPLTLVLGRADGLPATRPRLSGGGAWLASPGQGLVTLIDGASAQVVGSVRVPGARAGDELSAVQDGSSAYLVDSTRGTVSRVDGGTYQVTPPVRFGSPGGQLTVLAGGPGLYIVDGSRRLASVTDPVTLRVRQRLSLAAAPGPGQSVVDDAGRLWVVDSGGAGLTWFDPAKHVRPDVGTASSRLVLVGGRPVLLDGTRPRLGRLGPDGAVRSWSCMDTRAGDRAELLGSAVTGRVYAALPATGTLVAAGVDRDDCAAAVEVGRPGDRFGPLVESAGFVLVPNRTTGRTVVVDVSARQVVADLDVVRPGGRLELLAKDGLVFYNDLDSDRAGVIRFDGGQWRVGPALRKYERSRTGAGILTPSGGAGKQPVDTRPPADPRRTQPDPARPGPQQPAPAGPTGRSNPGQDNPTPSATQPGPAPGSAPAGPPGPPPPPPRHPPVIRSLTWTPNTVVREVAARFTAVVTDAQGATWTWTILDPAGTVLQQASTADRMTVTLPAGTPDHLRVRLEVRNAVGAATPVTKPFTTTASLAPQISSLTATPADAGIGQPVDLAAVEAVAGSRGTWTWTVAGPGGPTGPISAPPLQDLTRTFDTAGQYTVTLTVAYDGARAERSVQVTVSDKARLVKVTGEPVDLRHGTTPSVQVKVIGSFVPQAVGIRTETWLHASDFGGVTVDPGGTASFLVGLNGTPPADGVNSAAVTMFLGNGDEVSFDVLVNLPPVWNNYAVCLDATGVPGVPPNSVQFLADFTDANVAGLTVTLHVGGSDFRMEFVDGGASGHGQFFSLFVPTASLPTNARTWTVTAVDDGGLDSDVGGAPRGPCW